MELIMYKIIQSAVGSFYAYVILIPIPNDNPISFLLFFTISTSWLTRAILNKSATELIVNVPSYFSRFEDF